MKFLDRIDKYSYMLLEAEGTPPPPPGASQPQTPQDVQAAQGDQAQPQQPAQETEKLAPESEVMLVRLLKKAFVIAPKPEDIEQITSLEDINENNAREVLTKIINLIKKYSSDVDVNT